VLKAWADGVTVSFGHNALQFENNPILGSWGDITLGNVINYGTPTKIDNLGPFGQGPEDPIVRVRNGNATVLAWTNGEHEILHTYQSAIFGPLFLPVYGVGGIGALVRGGNFFVNRNFMETGPYMPITHNTQPQIWP